MEAPGDLVAAAAELAAGVEGGHDHFERGLLLLRMAVDRDATTVVLDRDQIVLADGANDLIADTRPAPRRPSCRPTRGSR